MTKGKELFPKSKERLDGLVEKIKKSFGDTEKALLEKLKKEYTSLKIRGYNVHDYERFYKEFSEKRRQIFNHRFKEIGDECNIYPR